MFPIKAVFTPAWGSGLCLVLLHFPSVNIVCFNKPASCEMSSVFIFVCLFLLTFFPHSLPHHHHITFHLFTPAPITCLPSPCALCVSLLSPKEMSLSVSPLQWPIRRHWGRISRPKGWGALYRYCLLRMVLHDGLSTPAFSASLPVCLSAGLSVCLSVCSVCLLALSALLCFTHLLQADNRGGKLSGEPCGHCHWNILSGQEPPSPLPRKGISLIMNSLSADSTLKGWRGNSSSEDTSV